MVLNYKRIPYKESFLSYPDIKSFGDHFQIPYDDSYDPPTTTLPAIVHYDENNRVIRAMSGSQQIARYLDEIYPDHPTITLPNTPGIPWDNMFQGYFSAFRAVFTPAWETGFNIIIPLVPDILDDRGSAYFVETRTKSDEQGRSPRDWGAKDPEDDWKPFLIAVDRLTKIFEHTNESSPFLLGSKPCYVDFVVVAWLVWHRRGSEVNFKRIIDPKRVGRGKLGDHYRRCVDWAESQGEVVKWDPETM
jgi:glutathione S-transferase